MDTKLAWFPPEHFGLAYALWSKIWENNCIPNGPNERLMPVNVRKTDQVTKVCSTENQNVEKTLHQQIDDSNGEGSEPSPPPPLPISVPAVYRNAAAASDQQDFTPVMKRPTAPSRYKKSEIMLTPWLNIDVSQHKFMRTFKSINKSLDRLHTEIIQFYEYMMPTDSERAVRKQVISNIISVIENNLDGVTKVEVFGSYRTGLCLPTSDVDLVVFGVWPGNVPPLRELEEIFINNKVAGKSNVKVLDRASVPIIKLTDEVTEIRFDISFNMENGAKSADLIKGFMAEFPALKYLVLVLKHFLLQRELNEVFTGGIGSYSLIMMTVSLLQLHPHLDSRSFETCNLGELLTEFFELYGRNFNYMRVCIRVRNGGAYLRKDELLHQFSGGHRASVLSIEDPLNLSNDIGKSSYGALNIRVHFDKAFTSLSHAVSVHNSFVVPETSILGRIVRVSSEIIEYRKWIECIYLKHSNAAAKDMEEENGGGKRRSVTLSELPIANNSRCCASHSSPPSSSTPASSSCSSSSAVGNDESADEIPPPNKAASAVESRCCELESARSPSTSDKSVCTELNDDKGRHAVNNNNNGESWNTRNKTTTKRYLQGNNKPWRGRGHSGPNTTRVFKTSLNSSTGRNL